MFKYVFLCERECDFLLIQNILLLLILLMFELSKYIFASLLLKQLFLRLIVKCMRSFHYHFRKRVKSCGLLVGSTQSRNFQALNSCSTFCCSSYMQTFLFRFEGRRLHMSRNFSAILSILNHKRYPHLEIHCYSF